jgi:hypothetical protein
MFTENEIKVLHGGDKFELNIGSKSTYLWSVIKAMELLDACVYLLEFLKQLFCNFTKVSKSRQILQHPVDGLAL